MFESSAPPIPAVQYGPGATAFASDLVDASVQGTASGDPQRNPEDCAGGQSIRCICGAHAIPEAGAVPSWCKEP